MPTRAEFALDSSLLAKKKSIGSQLVAMRYAKMTAEERKEAASNAAATRWARWRKDNKKPAKPGDEKLIRKKK